MTEYWGMEEAGTSQPPFPPIGRRMIDEFPFSGRKITATFGLHRSMKYQLRRTVGRSMRFWLIGMWESLYPGKALPVKRRRKTTIKESMETLNKHFKMNDPKKRQLPVDPVKFVPMSHEKDGISFVVPESLEEGGTPRTEYLRPWETVIELPAYPPGLSPRGAILPHHTILPLGPLLRKGPSFEIDSQHFQ